MKKETKYSRVFFNSNSYEKIYSEFQNIVSDPSKTTLDSLIIYRDTESWEYDTFEEYISEIRNGCGSSYFSIENPELRLLLMNYDPNVPYSSNSSASIRSKSREYIIRLSNIIDNCAEDCFLPEPEKPKQIPLKPKIFIGHGNSTQWRDLKDHLQDQHGYQILSYETGSRAGHTIRDVVSELLLNSSFAILVMTGEDKMEDGTARARQNVIHEIGLFQGRLGFTKAIVLKEEGTEEFSNIHGVHQLRYSPGNIKETFGEVIATLNREFGMRR